MLIQMLIPCGCKMGNAEWQTMPTGGSVISVKLGITHLESYWVVSAIHSEFGVVRVPVFPWTRLQIS